MRIRQLASIPSRPVSDLAGVTVQRLGLVGTAELKAFTLGAGSSTLPHHHAHTHLVLVLAGSGALGSSGARRAIGTGDVITIAPNERHRFMAEPGAHLRFACLDSPGE